MAAITGFGKRGDVRAASAHTQPLATRSAPQIPSKTSSASKPSWLARIPFASFGLTALLVAIFLFECRHALDAGPGLALSHRTIVVMGGVSGDLVLGHHQWWRLFTAPLLHGSLEHIAGNAAVLLLVGWLLEPLIGTAWFVALFAVGAFGGALASTIMNPAEVVSVGASGAIMALLTATFVCSFHDEAFGVARRMRILTLRLIVPSLLPSLAGAASHTDFSAHTGGAIAGVAMGFALMILWPENEPRPAAKPIAIAISAIGAALAAVAFWMATQASPIYEAQRPGLIPQNEMPRSATDGAEVSEDLVTRYPADPRAHLFRAIHFLKINDVSDAGDQLRTGLGEIGAARDELSDKIEPAIRLLLAEILVSQGRTPEAVTMASTACGPAHDIPDFANILADLQKANVCG